MSPAPRTSVTSLLLGLLLLPLAGLALWVSFGLAVSWPTVAVAVPLLLVAVGVVGLLTALRPVEPHHPRDRNI